jgi:acylphosphatase
MKKAIALHIKGKVQGVGFRYYTKQIAKELNIAGFVKNQHDGSVYIEALGEDWEIDQFIESCKQGPAWARVDDIIISTLPLFDGNIFVVK